MNIVVIGVGLIGGSLALNLKGFQTHIIGVDNNETHSQKAVELGIVDTIMPLHEAVKIADLVVLALPVNTARKLLPQILDEIRDDAVVTDMGSTKKGICDSVRSHPRRSNYVAAHPIAGTENSGPSAAFAGLFSQKFTIICEKELSNPSAVKTVERMFNIMNMNILYMDPAEHDMHTAYVSHLSHITSFTLGLTVLEMEKDVKNIFTLAGSGFASTVRLAKSSAEMWAPIFEQNAEVLSVALDKYIENLQLFKNAIVKGEFQKTVELMREANKIRPVLEGIPGIK